MTDVPTHTEPLTDTHRTYLIYDGDCPACRHYMSFMGFREAVGEVTLINAREAIEWVAHLRRQQMPLDEGMVLIHRGQYFHGAEALHRMALLSSNTGWFNRVQRRLFESRARAGFLYPILKTLRNALLRLLRRDKIEP